MEEGSERRNLSEAGLNQLVYYNCNAAASICLSVCVSVCLCVCTPPFFSKRPLDRDQIWHAYVD